MKKLLNISQESVTYIEKYSKQQGVTQSQVVETALQIYMAIKNGITSDITIRKNKAYVWAGPEKQMSIDDL